MSAGYAGLYSQSPEVNASECELDDGLFKEAFKRLGVADVAAANKQSKALEAKQKAGSADTDTDMKDANQSADAELAGWSDSSRPPLFQHLQHTLILLATVARAQVSHLSLPYTRPAYIKSLQSTSWPALKSCTTNGDSRVYELCTRSVFKSSRIVVSPGKQSSAVQKFVALMRVVGMQSITKSPGACRRSKHMRSRYGSIRP